MKRTLTILSMAAAALAGGLAFASDDAPKPLPIPADWELEISYDTLMPITMKVPGEDKVQTFWYLRYTLVNRTGDEQLFAPQVALYTDTGELVRASQGVPGPVYLAIQRRYNNPLMRDQTAMAGRILQGRDNARRGVMIFRDFDRKAGSVDIFIGGLSGESVRVKLPQKVELIEVDEKGNLVKVMSDTITMNKTLQLSFDLAGDLGTRGKMTARLSGRQWVMR